MVKAIINGVEVSPVELHVDKKILDEHYKLYTTKYEQDLCEQMIKDLEKLNVGELLDLQAFKLFREQGEHIEAHNLTEAIFLGDNHIYRDAPKYIVNFIVANPTRRKDLEKLIKGNGLTNKTCLYSNIVDSNEIFCIHSDELMFPAHSESSPARGFAIKMDNPCLVKVIKILDKEELE